MEENLTKKTIQTIGNGLVGSVGTGLSLVNLSLLHNTLTNNNFNLENLGNEKAWFLLTALSLSLYIPMGVYGTKKCISNIVEILKGNYGYKSYDTF